MIFEGIYFNDAHIASMTQAQFVKHERHTLPENKLMEVYAICKAMHNGDGEKSNAEIIVTGRNKGGNGNSKRNVR